MIKKTWSIYSPSLKLQKEIATALNTTTVFAQILINRGYKTVTSAKLFLENKSNQTFSPWDIKDMDKAVDLLSRAIHGKKKITIYGDYDVDGITGTTILFQALEGCGGMVSYYLPDRLKEGYGLNSFAMETLAREGTCVLVTVDCGTTALKEVQTARDLGMEVVIVDHHELLSEFPAASAFINLNYAANRCARPWRRQTPGRSS